MPRKSSRKPKADRPFVVHGPDCMCRGTGLVAGRPFVAANGVRYEKVSARCPGVKAWESPPSAADQKTKAAGETG